MPRPGYIMALPAHTTVHYYPRSSAEPTAAPNPGIEPTPTPAAPPPASIHEHGDAQAGGDEEKRIGEPTSAPERPAAPTSHSAPHPAPPSAPEHATEPTPAAEHTRAQETTTQSEPPQVIVASTQAPIVVYTPRERRYRKPMRFIYVVLLYATSLCLASFICAIVAVAQQDNTYATVFLLCMLATGYWAVNAIREYCDRLLWNATATE